MVLLQDKRLTVSMSFARHSRSFICHPILDVSCVFGGDIKELWGEFPVSRPPIPSSFDFSQFEMLLPLHLPPQIKYRMPEMPWGKRLRRHFMTLDDWDVFQSIS